MLIRRTLRRAGGMRRRLPRATLFPPFSAILPTVTPNPRVSIRISGFHTLQEMAGEGDGAGGGAAGPKTLRRREYLPPPVLVDEIFLRIDLADVARVAATLVARRNKAFVEAGGDSSSGDVNLDVNPKHVTVESVQVNGQVMVSGDDWVLEGQKLRLFGASLDRAGAPREGDDTFLITSVTRQKPAENLELSGLYQDKAGMFCTQMEAQGFRRFVPHFDRPDVLSLYTVIVTGDKAKCPVLLSNCNKVAEGEGPVPADALGDKLSDLGNFDGDDSGRHWVKYVDPHPKPSYLFAVVGGDLAELSGTFETMSGKECKVRFFSDAKDIDKCHHALQSLKDSMAWDERAFGREVDVDEYAVVCTSSFTMGAMENKALNVFNTKYTLATPRTATDTDFNNVARVIAHEYAHNWSGNRVTCASWFELTLKEGFTVFRDQEFTSDTASRALKRIKDATVLRAAQFAEDSGPMSHPPRPDEVQAIDNFYSVTVYEKGAEVVRLYDTLLGRPAFRRATDHYFDRFDGKAVTCNDFCTAMEEANWDDLPEPVYSAIGDKPGEDEDKWVDPPYTRTGPRPLTQFRRWYAVGGTPEVRASGKYDPATRTYTLRMEQSVPDTPTQAGPKPPLHIPIRVGLIGPDGKDMDVKLRDDPARWDIVWGAKMKAVDGPASNVADEAGAITYTLHLTEPAQEFVFEDVPAGPVPSMLRGFSAPIRLTLEGETDTDRLFRMANDADPFNTFDAANELSIAAVLDGVGKGPIAAEGAAAAPFNHERLYEAFGALLSKVNLDVDDPDVSLSGLGADPALVAHILGFPPIKVLIQEVHRRDGAVDPTSVARAVRVCKARLAHAIAPQLIAAYRRLTAQLAGREYRYHPADVERRALRNVILGLLASAVGRDAPDLGPLPDGFDPVATADELLSTADNMTDEIAAVSVFAILPADNPARASGLEAFYERHKDEALCVNKWMTLQAMTGTAEDVIALRDHEAFSIDIPNDVYSVFGAFGMANYEGFHDPSGAGYDVMAEAISTVDEKNAQVAARIAGAFMSATQVTPDLRALMRTRIDSLLEKTGGLSDNTAEVLGRTVKALDALDGAAAGGGGEE